MKKSERFEAIRAESKAKIITAAHKLFSENGYNNTSISQIAKENYMAKGALYHYFSTKEELLEAIFEKESEVIFEFYNALATDIASKEKLSLFLKGFNRSLSDHNTTWRLLTNMFLQKEKQDVIQKYTIAYAKPFHNNIRKIFTDLRVKDINLEISYLFSLLYGWQVMAVSNENQFDTIAKQIGRYLEKL